MAIADARATAPSAVNAMGQSPHAVPRDYNFAADLLQMNLDAGRAEKPA